MLLVRRVRARRWSLLAAAVVAIVAALAASYDLSASSSPLRERDRPYAVATLRILIDTDRQSAISDAQATPELLASRGTIYADLSGSDEVVADASRRAGVPEGTFPIIPSLTQSTTTRPGLTAAAPSGDVPEGSGAAVTVRTNAVSPLLEVDARGPTPREAAAYAVATAEALAALVTRTAEEQDVRERDRIVLRRLGNPQTSTVANKQPLGDVATLALGIFAVLVAAIIAIDLLVLQGRSETGRARPPARA